MKTIRNFEFILSGIIVAVQRYCTQLCHVISASDLILEDILAKQSISAENEVIYEIVHLSLNTMQGIACPELGCEGAKIAGEHKYPQNIYYSENYSGNKGTPVESFNFSHLQNFLLMDII